jgi:hypothetical protein
VELIALSIVEVFLLLYRIGTDARNKTSVEVKPGPGQYNPYTKNVDNHLLQISAKFGRFGKENHHKLKFNETPGPTQYSPNYKVNRPGTPSSSMAKKYK